MPVSLERIGDHLRKARIERGLEQKDVARMLGVSGTCVWWWENHRYGPPVSRCKGVIDFLGYDPFPKPATFAERLVAFRRTRGLRIKDAAALAGVDPCSWSSWEREEHRITRACHASILSVLGCAGSAS